MDGNTKVYYNGDAQIPEVEDLEKFLANVPRAAEVVKVGLNGTSFRVSAQGVCRRELEKNANATAEYLQETVYNSVILGARSSGGTRTIVKTIYTLPNGEKYEGTSATEFKQLWVAAMVDLGTPAAQATEMVEVITLPEGLQE